MHKTELLGVMRDTRLSFAAGTRVHELTDTEGRVFVLFAHGVDPTASQDELAHAAARFQDESKPLHPARRPRCLLPPTPVGNADRTTLTTRIVLDFQT